MNEDENSIPPKNYNRSPRAHRPGLVYGQTEGLWETVERLHNRGRHRSALDEIFRVLNEDPYDPEALDLALIVFGGIRTTELQALEPLTPAYMLDRRLDPIVTECSRCGKWWIGGDPLLMPGMQSFGKRTYMINSGAPRAMQCYHCGYVLCSECLTDIKADDPLAPRPLPKKCPVCDANELKRPAYPTGRLPQQMARHADPVMEVIVFREGPVPPDETFLRELIEQMSPDAIEDRAKLIGVPFFPWPANVEATAANMLAEKEARGEIHAGRVEVMSAIDDQGNRLYIFKLIQPALKPSQSSAPERTVVEGKSLLGQWKESIGKWFSSVRPSALDRSAEELMHNHSTRIMDASTNKSNAEADYSFVRDETGSACGIWLRDPSDLDKPGMVETLLMMRNQSHLLTDYLNKRYRKVPNQYDSSGGCFVMFGSVGAPGEKG